jgi:predicted NUDIX family phosphoesterase
MDVKIWAIPEKYLFEQGEFSGFVRNRNKYFLDLFRKYGQFLQRGPLEENPKYKQIIGQVVLQVGDRFLLHRVNASSTEERLHNLWPILLGGHIEEVDVRPDQDIVLTAIEREFQEEVEYHGNILRKTPLGVIYLGDNAVNRVHVGLIYHFLGDSLEISSREDVIGDLQFVTKGELQEMSESLTYWSRLLVPIL